jgi:hypothetical protein
LTAPAGRGQASHEPDEGNHRTVARRASTLLSRDEHPAEPNFSSGANITALRWLKFVPSMTEPEASYSPHLGRSRLNTERGRHMRLRFTIVFETHWHIGGRRGTSMAFNLLSNGGGALRDGCGVGATGPFRHACRERDKQPPQRRGGGARNKPCRLDCQAWTVSSAVQSRTTPDQN